MGRREELARARPSFSQRPLCGRTQLVENVQIRRPLLSLGLSGAAPRTAQREAITNDFGRMLHACNAGLPKPVHRSLACQSRCMSLFRRFESTVCQASNASRQPAGPLARPQPFPGPLAAHACTAALPAKAGACHSLGVSKALFARLQTPLGTLPAKAGACHSLGVSKAPFARRQTPLGTQQGRWPGSTALPGTFGCTCLHLACQSRCMSLLKRFESAVCQPSKASRHPAGPLARLDSPSRDLWLHMPAPQPCLPKPVHVTP